MRLEAVLGLVLPPADGAEVGLRAEVLVLEVAANHLDHLAAEEAEARALPSRGRVLSDQLLQRLLTGGKACKQTKEELAQRTNKSEKDETDKSTSNAKETGSLDQRLRTSTQVHSIPKP